MSYYTSHKVNGWSVRPQEVHKFNRGQHL